ncbi:hypothetical protein BC833DRAFT_430513 [Globomyces pollinis-pini]|nr:hypothetical protein BC833DRAFT_430513 [Globomyces pollinis-pini]
MHYLLVFLFLSRGLSRSVLESQWLVSNACSGPPDLMKVFEYIEPKPMDDENHFFNLFRDFTSPIPYQIGSCGYLSETLSDSCCYVSIDPDEIVDITSASPIVIDSVETDFSQHMYKSANENSYCSIKPISDTFFGNFEAVMFLASTTCIDYYYKCESNGMFTYYMEEGCQGDFLAIELKEEEQLFNTTDYGIFNGKWITIETGSKYPKWLTYYPLKSIIPLNPFPNADLKWDYTALTVRILTIAINGLTLLAGIYKFYKDRKRFLAFWILNQALWLIYSCITLSMMLQLYLPEESMILEEAQNYSLGICTFSGIPLIIIQLFSIKISGISNTSKSIFVVFIILLYFILGGSVYVANLCTVFNINRDASICTIIQSWKSLVHWWILGLLIVDLIPIIMIMTFIILQNKSIQLNQLKFYQTFFTIDFTFSLGMITQLIIIMIYIGFYPIMKNNLFLGGDKAYFAVLCLLGFLRSIHFTLNLLILDRIPVIFRKSVNKIKDFNRINRAMESQMTDSKTH